jgi:hypothetical protein
MHFASAWHWLIANGLYKDLLAAVVALTVTRMAAWRPLRRLAASQRRIEDLLNTDSPGGLREVVRALRGDGGDQDDGDADIDARGQGQHHPGAPPPVPPHHIR